ncbi:hypothetical protein BDN72DRAFT_780512, partial [Pluteus cervinus]
LAKVEPTTSTPEFIPPGSVVIRKKKGDIVLTDVPSDIQHKFKETFLTLLRQYFGSELRPWDPLPDSKVSEMFNSLFPDYGAWFQRGGSKIVLTLADDCLSRWRSKIGIVTIDMMKQIVTEQFDDDEARVEEWCRKMLSGPYASRPFYYGVYKEATEAEGEVKKVSSMCFVIFHSSVLKPSQYYFCHPLIANALGYHLKQVLDLPPSEARPTSALVMAIQSVSLNSFEDQKKH